MKKYFSLIVILSVVSLFAQTEPTDTDADGYRNISTLSHLQWLTLNTGAWDENYELDNDIDAYDTRDWNDGAGWLPVGNTETAFTGKFNGNGYTIQNLYISRGDENYIGFFGYTNGNEVIIENLSFSDIDITGNKYVSGLAGYTDGGYFNNIHVNGTVTGNNNYIGAIAGSSTGSVFHYISTDCAVSGLSYTGGAFGEFYSDSEVRHSYSLGTLDGETRTGGFVGSVYGGNTQLIDCYSQADVSGTYNVGGFAGYIQVSTVFRCYSAGSVDGSGSGIGGFLGDSDGYVYYSYWDTQTSGQTVSAGGTGKTTAEMKQQSTFAQFNFDNLWEINGDYPEFQDLTVYTQPEETELSELSGSGTENDPYILTTASEFNAMRNNLSAYYRLGNAIDLSSTIVWNYGRGWEPVGSETEGENFTGNLDGYGFTLTGLSINCPLSDGMGLFGYMNGAEIKNISFENFNISGNDYAGTIAGKSESSYFSFINVESHIAVRDGYAGGISGVSASDLMHYLNTEIDIFGVSYIGGISGQFEFGSEIRHSHSDGNITASGSTIGGLFGKTYSYETIISDCFSSVDVSGTTNIGGLIGYHQTAEVYRSFSYGSVSGTGASLGGLIGGANGSTYYSYWDTETSGQETSAGGTGKTTAEMQQIATYPQFDFTYLWEIDEDNSYPYFRDLSIYDLPQTVELSSLAGTGTEEDPYIITDADELNAMRDDLTAYYKLGNNIDLSSTLIWNYGRGWEPVGNDAEGEHFTGSLNGADYTLTGFHISRPLSQYQGLFGYTDNAVLSNIIFDKSYILGDAKTGTLAGFALQTKIKYITIKTHIVSSNNEIGGLAGIFQEGIIMSAYSDSEIYGANYLGGLIGYFGYEFYNNGSQMRYCSSSGNIYGNSTLGGLIGKSYNGNTIIADCYSNANVSGNSELGGLIGYHQVATVYRSFSYGSVTGYGASVGGLIGSANGRTYYSFWDTETSGQESSDGGSGKTTSEMQQIVTYPQFNFNFLWNIDENNSYPYFRDLSHYSLPEAVELSSLAGTGTEEDPYIITDVDELNAMRNDLTAHYKLGNNIDLTSSIIWNYGKGWEPVGKIDSTESRFSGTFDGDGHTIKGMHISRARSSYQGLFGVIENATVKNLKIVSADLLAYQKVGTATGYSRTSEIHNTDVITNLISSNNEIGGIAGMVFEGGIYNSSADVNIYAENYAGGIAGYLGEGFYNDGSDLQNSFSTGELHGYGHIGGLAGQAYNGATKIQNCFSRANVYATSTSGGAVGYLQLADIYYSYTTGLVEGDATSLGGMVGGANGSAINSYWDTETSGKTSSARGIAKLTENMVYPYSGVVYEEWDFTNTWSHDVDGDVNDGYPYLQGFDDILFVDAPTLNSPDNESEGISLSPTLTWNSVDNATDYILEFASDDAFNNIVETAYITATNYQINNLPYYTEYFWRVKAYNGFTESEWSEVWSFTTYSFNSLQPVLLAPADESADILSTQEFSWETMDNADSYDIQISSTDDFSNIVFQSSALTETSVTATGLLFNTEYFWRIRAYNDELDEYSSWSLVWSFTTYDFANEAPVLLSPENESTDLLLNTIFSWNETDEADSYEIQIASDVQFNNVVYSENVSETSQQAQNLELSNTYYWRVRAYNTENDTYSIWSNIWSFTTTDVVDKIVNLKMYYYGLFSGNVHKNVAVLVELRSGDNLMSSDKVIQKSAILDDNGECTLNFSETDEGDYWVIVRAIGYMPVCTHDKYTFDGTEIEHNFTTSSSQSIAGQSCMLNVGNTWQIAPGDFNGDRSVGAFDVNYFIPAIGRSVSSQIPGE